MRKLVALFLACLGTSFATTLISTSAITSESSGFFALNGENTVGQGWSQTVSSYSTSIGAGVVGSWGHDVAGQAYLMMYLPGSESAPAEYTAYTAASFTQVATAPFVAPAEIQLQNIPLTTIFSGLTLDPGRYYLLLHVFELEGNLFAGPAAWSAASRGLPTIAPGFTVGGGLFGPATPYPPAGVFYGVFDSDFNRVVFAISGDLTAVPEPTYTSALAIAVLAFLASRKRRVACERGGKSEKRGHGIR